ncbi:MAG: hypothetical protein GWN00_38335 [Aliifodinibius sp.]|nr:hypothetical protein [Fodinibius sp.]NIV16479.1 hypothetical protein [Fodinibius sp.]NIY30434.1 hypothetical protein [Fodinibius sp.]
MKKTILAAFVSILIGLILTEITLNLFFPIGDPYKEDKEGRALIREYIETQHEPNLFYRFYSEPGLSGMDDSTRFTTNNLGFRGPYLERPKTSNEYRVFMVGGSTTECIRLDDSLAITYLLQEYLNSHIDDSISIKVYNAGKSGDKTYDHLAMLVHRIMHLEPDLIIIFCGFNDLTAAAYNKDYIHLPVYQTVPQIKFSNYIKFLLTEFQIPRRLYYGLRPILSDESTEEIQMRISFTSNYKEKARLNNEHPISSSQPRVDLVPYKTNLISIIGLAQVNDADLVFMTQATSWNSKIDPQTREWHWTTYKNGVRYKEAYLDQALEEYNDVMRNVSGEFRIPLFDTYKLVPKSLEYFYDDCHFNINGSIYTSDLLGDFILREIDFHDRDNSDSNRHIKLTKSGKKNF